MCRPVPYSQGDACYTEAILNFCLEPHQLAKLFSTISVVDKEDDEGNYKPETEEQKLLI